MARGTPVDVLLGCLDRLDLGRSVLVAGADADPVAEALVARGLATRRWARRLGETRPPRGIDADLAPWPSGGPYESAILRLPKARAEALMDLHALASVVAAGGRILVAGGNDEGIRPLVRTLAEVAGNAETVETRGHARVLRAVRPDELPGLKPQLSDWKSVAGLELAGVVRPWAFYPGVFADGRLDDGTALLLSHLPTLVPGDAVLDYGAGTGVVSAAVLAAEPAAQVVMLDEDTVALAAARENVPGAVAIAGLSLAAVAGRRFKAILSNPPIHAGKAESHRVLERLIAEAPAALQEGGEMRLVVQRRIGLDRMLGAIGRVEVLADDGRFRVWRVAP